MTQAQVQGPPPPNQVVASITTNGDNPRPLFLVMRGISGSGKSTIAKGLRGHRPKTIIVSRDDLRLALYGVPFGPPIDENYITAVETATITAALSRGISVISDNTNLYATIVNPLFATAYALGADIRLHEVDTTLIESKKRNQDRADAGGRFVPEYIIDKQHRAFYENREEIAASLKRFV